MCFCLCADPHHHRHHTPPDPPPPYKNRTTLKKEVVIYQYDVSIAEASGRPIDKLPASKVTTRSERDSRMCVYIRAAPLPLPPLNQNSNTDPPFPHPPKTPAPSRIGPHHRARGVGAGRGRDRLPPRGVRRAEERLHRHGPSPRCVWFCCQFWGDGMVCVYV